MLLVSFKKEGKESKFCVWRKSFYKTYKNQENLPVWSFGRTWRRNINIMSAFFRVSIPDIIEMRLETIPVTFACHAWATQFHRFNNSNLCYIQLQTSHKHTFPASYIWHPSIFSLPYFLVVFYVFLIFFAAPTVSIPTSYFLSV